MCRLLAEMQRACFDGLPLAISQNVDANSFQRHLGAITGDLLKVNVIRVGERERERERGRDRGIQ